MKKNQPAVLLLVLMIASSEFLVTSNALRLQPSFLAHSHSLYDTKRSETPEVLMQTFTENNDQLTDPNADLVTQAGNAINGVKTVVDSLKDFVKGTEATMTKFSDVVKGLTALGGAFTALGAVWSAFDILLKAGQKSDLDQITDRIGQAEERIRNDIHKAVDTLTLAAQKSAFYTAESKIKSAAEHLGNMTVSKTKKNQADFNYYTTQFKKDAKDTEDYIQQIYDAYQPSWSNGSPIFELIMKTYDGDWNKVAEALEVMTLWLLRAQLNYVAYLSITKKKDLIPSFIKDFQKKMNVIAKYVATLPEKNFDIAHQAIKSNLTTIVNEACTAGNDGDNNQACANAVLARFQAKYPKYLLFTVIAVTDRYGSSDYQGMVSIGRTNFASTAAQQKNVFVYFTLNNGCKQLPDTDLKSRLQTGDNYAGMVSSDTNIKQQFYSDQTSLVLRSASNYKIASTAVSDQLSKRVYDDGTYSFFNFGFTFKLDPSSKGPCYFKE